MSGLSAKDPSPPPLQGTRCSWEHRASLAGRRPLPGLALLDFPPGGGRAGHSCRQSLASGCAFLWRGEACTPGCDRDVQGVAAASQGRVSMRAVQKRSLQETMGRREQRQVPRASRQARRGLGGRASQGTGCFPQDVHKTRRLGLPSLPYVLKGGGQQCRGHADTVLWAPVGGAEASRMGNVTECLLGWGPTASGLQGFGAHPFPTCAM